MEHFSAPKSVARVICSVARLLGPQAHDSLIRVVYKYSVKFSDEYTPFLDSKHSFDVSCRKKSGKKKKKKLVSLEDIRFYHSDFVIEVRERYFTVNSLMVGFPEVISLRTPSSILSKKLMFLINCIWSNFC